MLGSNLSIFCYNKEKYVSIWVMKEYGVKESWTKIFKIYNSKDVSFSPKVINFDHILENVEIYVESLVSPFPSEEGRTSDATKIQAKKTQIKTIK
ncbi:hypothetical protein H5410_049005 [Solanum commersonii]|uniref:F-box associated domain-containing protein n=1 Tax=Solanum commersonii TaxID=4109 RepID=A0A9J5XJU7_SOLCO|nr:hypothetical protein H5410_049005 [Solanum commersonii]